VGKSLGSVGGGALIGTYSLHDFFYQNKPVLQNTTCMISTAKEMSLPSETTTLIFTTVLKSVTT